MKFETPCCRCGFCCLNETCIISQEKNNIGKKDPCPELSFINKEANCGIAGIVPIGDGCCIAARCYKDKIKYNYADLPAHMKITIVDGILKRGR